MLPKSANYNTIWNDPAHYAETKIVCGVDTYTEIDIMSCNRTQTLFADYYDIGNTVMNQIEFSIHGATPTDIPRMSRIELWTRLWLGDGTDSTDWLPMGVYYTGKPNYDTEAELLTVTAYDEMYKTGVVPFEGGATVTAWDNPTLRQVASHIISGTTVADVIDTNFAGIGLELEDPTQVLDTITMPSIPFNYTVREILHDIAIACCGNWTIVFQDDNGTQKAVLRLLKVSDWSIPIDVSLGRNVISFEKGDEIPSVTDVYVYYGYDNNGVALYQQATATPNDGREYEAEIKTITDGAQIALVANEILMGLGGTFYKPYSASGAELDPACELGDTVTVNSVTSVIGTIVCNFNRGMWADICAEGIEPIDDFEFLSSSSNTASRIERSAEVNSAKIQVNADSITAEVATLNKTISDQKETIMEQVNAILFDENGLEVRLTQYTQDTLGNHASEQQQYIRYGNGELELGESGTNAKAVLTNEALKFYDPTDDVKAYIGVDELYNPNANPLEQGTINSSGVDEAHAKRVRTNGYISVSPNTQYVVTSDQVVAIPEYGSSKNFLSTSGWQDTPYTFTTSASTYYIRLTIRNSGNTNIVPADVTELSIKATDGDYKFFVINGHIVRQLELGDHWLLVASGSDTDNRLTFKWRT